MSDGRLICNDDASVGVFSQQEVEGVLRETKRELDRTFYRFGMTFPDANITVSLVSADRIAELSGTVYYPAFPSICGLTVPKFFNAEGEEIPHKDIIIHQKKPARAEYHMYIVNALPRARLEAICAHEYAHVWQFENVAIDRVLNLESKTQEGFCELVAYQLMDAMNQDFEKAVIRANLYTDGQADLLMEVERNYGFNKILQWMKKGKDLHLAREDLDRIVAVENDPATAPAATPFGAGSYQPRASTIPDTLMLKGIMGVGAKKLALINNQTFAASESAKVKVGKTNVLVQLVAIKDTSVVIRTNGTETTTEIFLQPQK